MLGGRRIPPLPPSPSPKLLRLLRLPHKVPASLQTGKLSEFRNPRTVPSDCKTVRRQKLTSASKDTAARPDREAMCEFQRPAQSFTCGRGWDIGLTARLKESKNSGSVEACEGAALQQPMFEGRGRGRALPGAAIQPDLLPLCLDFGMVG